MDRNKRIARQRLDKRYDEFPSLDKFAVPQGGWLRAIRHALGMTGRQLAARMAITPQSLGEKERSEVRQTIRLSTLRKAAEAMDGVLVYAIIPRRKLGNTVRERARVLALRALGDVDRTMALEDQAVSADDIEERIDDYIRENIRDADLWDER